MAKDRKKKTVKIKKKCCQSSERCRGCPLRPENRARAARRG